MKLKLSQIVEANPALARLGAEKLPAKMAYTIGRNIQKIRPELENYEKTRTDLIKNKYGIKADDETYQVQPKSMEKFAAEINGLLEVEIDLDLWTLKFSEFDRDISPLDLVALDWMFENDMSNGHTPRVNGRKRKK
jgi:hypothetical protein